MREPGPNYTNRQYQRPNQTWTCGLACDGESCAAGPTARGDCPALAECAPMRDGDRWVCNRSAVRGGTCEDGPTPDGKCCRVHKCRPVRSLRAMRGRFVAACSILAVGGLTVLLSANWRDRALSPGPLASHHAQLLERADSQANCAACHAAADRSVAGWTASLIVDQAERPTQSALCMECHAKTIPAELAVAPHNLPPEWLAQVTQTRSTQEAGALSRAVRATFSQADKVACATCHREHHGAHSNLATVDDAACQTCHQQQFTSFATDHPDFGNWPYERRTRIVFNHASHRGKHFAEKKQAFDCRRCHVDDASGDVQLLANYETACAACHDEKIATSVAKGVPMLALPMLDVEALKAAGHDIGAWPKEATGDFDGRMPPMMKLLLTANRDARDAIVSLGADFDFLDVDPDDRVHLAAAATIAVAIKALFADLGQRGPTAVRERLTPPVGKEIHEPDVAALMAGLSPDTMRATARWLPGLDVGKDAWPRAEKPRVIKNALIGARGTDDMERYKPTFEPIPAGDLLKYDAAGEWSRDDATYSIRYRPAQHADPVLAAWLDALASSPRLSEQPVAAAMFKELSKATAPGLCVSCHSIEQTASGTLTINWKAFDRSREPRSFTKFSHGPHGLLPQLADCAACHAINDTADTAASYTDQYPQRFVSEFKAMSKRHCAKCHTRAAAGDKCQSCHNYHVEAVEDWRLEAGGQRSGQIDSALHSTPPAFR